MCTERVVRVWYLQRFLLCIQQVVQFKYREEVVERVALYGARDKLKEHLELT